MQTILVATDVNICMLDYRPLVWSVDH